MAIRVCWCSALLLALQVTACTTWEPTTASPGQVIVQEQPARIRITDASGMSHVIEEPEVSDSAVVGNWVSTGRICSTAADGRVECDVTRYPGTVVSLDSVSSIAVGHSHTVLPIVLTAAGLALGWQLFFLLACDEC